MFDESKDVSNIEQFGAMVRMKDDQGNVLVLFLDLQDLQIEVTIDGTASFTGRKNGMIQKLCDEFPWILPFYSCNHRLQLALQEATNDSNNLNLKKVLGSTEDICSYYQGNVKRHEALKQIHKINDEEDMIELQGPSVVRWSMYLQLVNSIPRELPSIRYHLESVKDHNPIANGYFLIINKKDFIFHLVILQTVQSIIELTVKIFQQHCIDLSESIPRIQTLKDRLAILEKDDITSKEYMEEFEDDQNE
ncbi:MAG: hypothetical protein EZS28_000354 [Streblomastix strix]|uniref:DUF4371 domain-containing protein n=1 Tax=Streblomastix strix TaxID=222440 RepID=A0A5J4XBE0_9EUKA|nr:MAG: hypothetical protein EZS28_000354 [Streblomastix strix]